jgi:hypothetical protein
VPADPAPSPPSLARRIAVTLGVLVALLAARRLPLPLVEAEAYLLVVGPFYWLDPVLSPVALGLTPFVGGFLLVELVAQVDPSLRPLRHGSVRQRARLTRVAWVVAVGIAALQGWGIATYLQTVRAPNGLEVVEWGLTPRLVIAGSLVAGTLATAALAALVSRHGLCNGFAILFAVDAFGSLLRLAFAALKQAQGAWGEGPVLVALALVVVGPLVLAQRRREAAGGPRLPFPTCGLAVVQAPTVLLGFLAKLSLWVAAVRPLASAMSGGGWGLAAAEVAIVVALAALFARLFCPPAAVQRAFIRAGDPGAGAVLDALRSANRRSIAALGAVALAPIACALLGAPIEIPAAGILALAILVSVARDLLAEAAFRRRVAAPVATARPVHRVYAVEPALQALAAAGIPAFPRALRYRTLFHFFAPWAPVEILVPVGREPEAQEICARVVTGAPPQEPAAPSAAGTRAS